MMTPLPNTHNLENTRDLIKKLEDTLILPQFALASLDITSLYTNIPVKDCQYPEEEPNRPPQLNGNC
jgi:hypothetical protein